jgi:nucleotide-binding universal stress UspA family protein
MHTILAATDFSENAGWAVECAVRLALQRGAKLELFHVLTDTALQSLKEWWGAQEGVHPAADAEEKLGELRDGIAVETGLEPGATVVAGKIIDEILAASVGMDLVVMGERGAHRLRDQLLGTTADRVIVRSSAPTLIVKRRPMDAYRTVLVPVDFSAVSAKAVRASMDWAPAARTVVYNVCQEPFESTMYYASVKEALIDEYRRRAVLRASADMDEFVRGLVARPSDLKAEVRYGHPAAVILEAARDLMADLVVMGKQGRSALEGFVVGSVTRHVLPDVKADVLIVPE